MAQWHKGYNLARKEENMLDFYQIKEKHTKSYIEIYPDFFISNCKDLMVRGKTFYAVWDEDKGLWSTDEFKIQEIVDKSLNDYARKLKRRNYIRKDDIVIKHMRSSSTNAWKNYRNFIREMPDTSIQLDSKITFQNTKVEKKDYISKRLPYSLKKGSMKAYEELMSTLYDPEERAKLEWAIGSIINGDSKKIQKFIVLYGESGSGKSTVLNIIQMLFEGYYVSFEAKALTSSNNSFSTEPFKSNPLVAIQHDGDLSRIEDNSKLNSIIAHEDMTMNEKYKPSYTARSNAFLFMGTNKPVKITDARSGIIRRLIDVRPSGRLVPNKRYFSLMNQIRFELGAIAYHCLNVYNSMGKNYYAHYRPVDMMFKTDVFFNFVESYYHVFKEEDGVSLKRAWEMYKVFCEESSIPYSMAKYKFREELKPYFAEFHERIRIDGEQIRSYYKGFLSEKFSKVMIKEEEEDPNSLVIEEKKSILDKVLQDCQAQYATRDGKPKKKWDNVLTTLKDLDTTKLHYVRPPLNHIVIDFDLKDENGEKSVERNLEEASKWPSTYAEFSKSKAGIHLHYIYDGDAEKLSRVYSEGIEVKVFVGNASLRRQLSLCNNIPIATISGGLPQKGEKMINFNAVQSEKGLRDLIERNLRKEIHPGTKPSCDFIHKILEDAYSSGLKYDVTDMRPRVLAFANNSTNQAAYCVKLVATMKFASEEPSKPVQDYEDDTLVFFDVEVFPNLLLVVWKKEGSKKHNIMFNPTPEEIGELFKFKLVGFNCRRYDNHILYARYIGYDNQQLAELSQKIIIKKSKNSFFGEAYNISYADIYDYTTKRASLKKLEIDLDLHHKELDVDWTQPIPEEEWDKVAEYCCNDVDATEAVFHDRKQDFVARCILADLSGLTPNHTTQQHTAKIIFGNDKNPQDKFVYTDLSKEFPGYIYDNGKSTYRGEVTGEGGYVYAEPGMYTNVAVLDIASMHPTTINVLELFGPYTKNFKELLDARLMIKHKEYDEAKKVLGGVLGKYLESEDDAGELSYALKIVINIVYGLTAASFDNKFRDRRNIDNIVAKRGALFMIDLKNFVQKEGFQVVHIKTDSIKIPNPTPEIIEKVMKFGEKYGYTFEYETTYKKFCLVNDAVYIAQNENGKWEAVGAQFAQPYVFKTLFSKEPLTFKDLCETKTVSTKMYLDMNEDLSEDKHDYHFVGGVGSFCPIRPGAGGGVLLREKDGKYYAVTGTKGYRWLESEMVKELKKEKDIDPSYFEELVEAAIKTISKYGDFDWFAADDTDEETPIGFDDSPPWCYVEKGEKPNDKNCKGCSNYVDGEEPSCKERR